MSINPVLINRPSQEFIAALEAARIAALGANDDVSRFIRGGLPQEDDAVRFMAETIPIFGQVSATPEQAKAGGCANCMYLGLWADRWPGYAFSKHGDIWVFERGIRGMGGNLYRQTYRTLLHEMDHALNRDHVLDAMEAKSRNAQQSTRAAGMAFHPSPRPCHSCGG